ncbi:hypothetical protein KHV-MN_00048 [Cyprinid herpesvirus 3]|uniref:ORF39L n=1 Tax=Cyprinid herpesvirus 3 TaxID=180230 RepID=A0A060IBJ5_CYHV3|nr:ORF39L [Cyprinid herpesvirus 3]AOO32446.1 membrane protein ORF39 [Cyprinid herpesvirus 3]AVL27971.1 membrane protein ORF39 [Cyprinid herpesvirus 3]QQZ02127.1 hypothetical protein KHV-MN_00048 [Cyprinid herpesvirus 3]
MSNVLLQLLTLLTLFTTFAQAFGGEGDPTVLWYRRVSYFIGLIAGLILGAIFTIYLASKQGTWLWVKIVFGLGLTVFYKSASGYVPCSQTPTTSGVPEPTHTIV